MTLQEKAQQLKADYPHVFTSVNAAKEYIKTHKLQKHTYYAITEHLSQTTANVASKLKPMWSEY